MVSKHKERSPGLWDRSGPKESWQMPLRLMAEKSGCVSFAQRRMCGPCGAADDVTLTSQQVCRGSTHKQSLRRTKGGLQDHYLRVERARGQEEETKKLRAQVELLRKQQRVEKGLEAQGEPTRRGRGLEEDCKMEVDEEVDCKKKLDEQRRSLQKQPRDIEKFTDVDQMFRDSQKDKWKEQLQEIERKRTFLRAPEDAEEVSSAGQEEEFSQRSFVKKTCERSVKKGKKEWYVSRPCQKKVV